MYRWITHFFHNVCKYVFFTVSAATLNQYIRLVSCFTAIMISNQVIGRIMYIMKYLIKGRINKIFIQWSEERKHLKIYVEIHGRDLRWLNIPLYNIVAQTKRKSLHYERKVCGLKKYQYIPVSRMGKQNENFFLGGGL